MASPPSSCIQEVPEAAIVVNLFAGLRRAKAMAAFGTGAKSPDPEAAVMVKRVGDSG